MFVVALERAAAFLLAITSIQIHLALSQLVVLSECVCPGRELRLECTVVGGTFTVWEGTSFNCLGHGDEIILSHSRFSQSGGAVGQCNNGMIIGRSRNRTFDGLNFTYTSQLIINLPSLNATNFGNTVEGRTVQCVHDGVTVIGNHTIAYTRIPNAPPPDNVHLAQVSRHVLTFQWVLVQLVCSGIEYKVNATNCGLCPDATVNASVTCLVTNTDLLTSTSNDTLCTLSVETTVCGFQSKVSEAATAMLKAPGRPIINKVLPYYNFTSRQLTKIDVQIESDSNEERFYISNGTDGSIISYTFDINFSDSESNCTLPITTLPVSSCVDGVCTITLANLTSLPCYEHSSQAEVAVYASNVLTDGPSSTTSLMNTSNSLFFVTYEPLSNGFSCVFVGSYENKSCEITYGAMDPTDQTCSLDNQAARHVNSSGSLMLDTVTVFIPPLAQAKPAIYCFTAIGKTPYFTIAVEGTFTIGTVTSGNLNTTVILIAAISAICCVIIVLLLASIIAALSRIISKKKHTLKQREYIDQDEQQYDRTTFAQRQLRQVPPTHSEQTDEQQYDQSSFAQQQLPSTHLDQAEEQQYDLIFIQKQSKQPIASQQMVYSELGPTVTGRKTSNFVLGIDDRLEYAELDHRPHSHAVLSSDTATTCLAKPEAGNFDDQEDSPPPPPLPPKYTMM